MIKQIGLAAGAVLSLSTLPAHADIRYDLSNVVLYSAPTGGTAQGTLTGSFTTNDARSTLVAYNIVASPFSSFPGFTYTPATAPLSASTLPSQYFQLDAPGGLFELRLYFTSALTTSGATLNRTFSYESEASGGIRYAGGSIVAATAAVPELATWAMLVAGFGAVGFAMRRRQKVAYATV